jgi:hypothetical protein
MQEPVHQDWIGKNSDEKYDGKYRIPYMERLRLIAKACELQDTSPNNSEICKSHYFINQNKSF